MLFGVLVLVLALALAGQGEKRGPWARSERGGWEGSLR